MEISKEAPQLNNQSDIESNRDIDHSDTEFSESDDEEESESKTSGVYHIRTADSLEHIPELPVHESPENGSEQTKTIESEADVGTTAELSDDHQFGSKQATKRKLTDKCAPLGTCCEHDNETDPIIKKLKIDEDTTHDSGKLATIQEADEEVIHEEIEQVTNYPETQLSTSHKRHSNYVNETFGQEAGSVAEAEFKTDVINKKDKLPGSVGDEERLPEGADEPSTRNELSDDITNEHNAIANQNLLEEIEAMTNVQNTVIDESEQCNSISGKKGITTGIICTLHSEEIIALDSTCERPITGKGVSVHEEVIENLHGRVLLGKEIENACECIANEINDVDTLKDLAGRVFQAQVKGDNTLYLSGSTSKQEENYVGVRHNIDRSAGNIEHLDSLHDYKSSESTVQKMTADGHLQSGEQIEIFASQNVQSLVGEITEEQSQGYIEETAHEQKEPSTAVTTFDEESQISQRSTEVVLNQDHESSISIECLPDGETTMVTDSVSELVESTPTSKPRHSAPEIIANRKRNETSEVIDERNECTVLSTLEPEQGNCEPFEVNGNVPSWSPENVTDKPLVETSDALNEDKPQQSSASIERDAEMAGGITSCSFLESMAPECHSSGPDNAEEFDSTPCHHAASSEETNTAVRQDEALNESNYAPEIVSGISEVPKNLPERNQCEASASVVVSESQTNQPQNDLLKSNTSLEIQSVEPQTVDTLEESFSERNATSSEEVVEVDVVKEKLEREETLAPQTIIQPEGNAKTSVLECVETEMLDKVNDVGENKTMESLTDTCSRPVSRTLDQSLTLEITSPIKVTKVAASSKKALASEMPLLDANRNSTICATTVAEIVERVSPQKTSPIKDNGLNTVTTEEQEQFVDALTSTDSLVVEVQDDATDVKQDASHEALSEITGNETNCQALSTGFMNANGSGIEDGNVLNERKVESGRLREADCIGLPSPPKRRRLQSDRSSINDVKISLFHDSKTAEPEEPFTFSLEPQISSTPVTDIAEPILCSQLLKQVSHDGSGTCSETLTEEELNLALLGSQTDGISDTDSNKENIPPYKSAGGDFNDTGSCEDITSQTEEDADSALSETTSQLGSQEQPLVLDDTEIEECRSDSEHVESDSSDQEQESVVTNEEFNAEDSSFAQAAEKQSGKLYEKRCRDDEEEPPEKRSRSSIDEPILSTQDLVASMPDQCEVESYSTGSSIQIVGELGPGASSPHQHSAEEDYSTEEDEDKENQEPPDFMDAPVQNFEEPRGSSDDAKSSSYEISQTDSKSDTDDSIEEIEDSNVQSWDQNQATRQSQLCRIKDSGTDDAIEFSVPTGSISEKSDTDDEIEEIDPNFECEKEDRDIKDITEDRSNANDDILEIIPESAEARNPNEEEIQEINIRPSELSREMSHPEANEVLVNVLNSNWTEELGNNPVKTDDKNTDTQKLFSDDEDIVEISVNPEETRVNYTDMSGCDTQKIVPNEDEDVILEVNSEDFRGDTSIISSICPTQEIRCDSKDSKLPEVDKVPNEVVQYIDNTIKSAKEKLNEFPDVEITHTRNENQSLNNVINEIVAEEVQVMVLDDQHETKSTVSDNTLYNSDQQVISQISETQDNHAEDRSVDALSMDGLVDEVKAQDILVISDVKSLTEQSIPKSKEQCVGNQQSMQTLNVEESKKCNVFPLHQDGNSDDSVDERNTIVIQEGGQFDDADSDDSVPHCTSQMSQRRKSPKPRVHRTRSCRSLPYEKPNKLGITPMPFGIRNPTVATGRSIIRQSLDEVSRMAAEYPSPNASGLPTNRLARTSFKIEQVKSESPQSLTQPAWNVTIDEESSGDLSPEIERREFVSAKPPLTSRPGKF